MRILLVSVVLAAQAATPIFRIETDGFWLNLHHFLYVLGRAEAKSPDSRREAVAAAPADQAEGMKVLSDSEQQAWREIVTHYASTWSRKDVVFDHDLVAIGNALKLARGETRAPVLTTDPALAAVLERAAPLYRKAWWTRHRDSNRAWRGQLNPLVATHGPSVLAFITRMYQEPWMAGGYPVNVVAFSNWAGAYSTSGSLLVVSSLSPNSAGSQGLETVFHESMHQWDEAIAARLTRLAEINHTPPLKDDLTHAMVFYTAGEAVRHAIPDHRPMGEAVGVWNRGLGPFKAALDRYWRPYLDGQGSLDAALIALLKS